MPDDGPWLAGASLDAGPGTLGTEPGGWLDVVEGKLLSVGDGSSDAIEATEPADAGESLGGGGTSSELRSLVPLGVASEPSEDGAVDVVGLVDPTEVVEPSDGGSAEEASGPEPELG